MGEIYRIDDGTSSIDISPIRGQNEPENRGRQILRGKDGKEDAHEWGGKQVFEAPFNNVSEVEADLLIDWWINMKTLELTPDLQNNPGTTLEVKIAEVTRPMQMWGGDWDTLFAGLLTLYEISSVSFSASSESVSGSKSCSEIPSSRSCSTGSSSSCANVVISVSTSESRSSSLSCSYSTSLSCSYSSSRSCSASDFSSCSASSHESGVGQSCSTGSSKSCSHSSSRSCSDSSSRSCSASVGVLGIGVDIISRSCSSLSFSSCSTSESSQSCSESGAG